MSSWQDDGGGSTSGTRRERTPSRGESHVRTLAGKPIMADDLSVAIERLRTSVNRLNAISDSAAQTVRDLEQFLDEAHVGLSARVEINDNADEPSQHRSVMSLAYSPTASGKFRIGVELAPAWIEKPGDVVFRPWSECSRVEKLLSFEKMPSLVLELANRVEVFARSAESTVTSINASLPLPKKRKGG